MHHWSAVHIYLNEYLTVLVITCDPPGKAPSTPLSLGTRAWWWQTFQSWIYVATSLILCARVQNSGAAFCARARKRKGGRQCGLNITEKEKASEQEGPTQHRTWKRRLATPGGNSQLVKIAPKILHVLTANHHLTHGLHLSGQRFFHSLFPCVWYTVPEVEWRGGNEAFSWSRKHLCRCDHISEDWRPTWPYIHVNNQREETCDGTKSISQAVYLWGWIRLSVATQNLYFSLDHACMLSRFSRVQPLPPCGQQTTRLLCPWNSPGNSTRVGCHFFLQGIFPTQGSSPCLLCLLHWQAGSFFFFYFILLYNTVLVLPYIDMNPPWVYTSS